MSLTFACTTKDISKDTVPVWGEPTTDWMAWHFVDQGIQQLQNSADIGLDLGDRHAIIPVAFPDFENYLVRQIESNFEKRFFKEDWEA